MNQVCSEPSKTTRGEVSAPLVVLQGEGHKLIVTATEDDDPANRTDRPAAA